MATVEAKINDLHREVLGLGVERYMSLARGGPKSISLASIPIPSGQLVEKATKFAYDTVEECIFNHCLRTFYFGSIIGIDQFPTWQFDSETFYLASLFHDLALSEKAIDNTVLSFEFDSALQARQFLLDNGAEKKVTEIVFEAVARHSDLYLDGKRTEASLLAMGAGLDVAGFFAPLLHEESLRNVVMQHPILDLPKRGAELMLYEMKKKNGQCHTKCYMDMGLEYMIANNPLLTMIKESS